MRKSHKVIRMRKNSSVLWTWESKRLQLCLTQAHIEHRSNGLGLKHCWNRTDSTPLNVELITTLQVKNNYFHIEISLKFRKLQ